MEVFIDIVNNKLTIVIYFYFASDSNFRKFDILFNQAKLLRWNEWAEARGFGHDLPVDDGFDSCPNPDDAGGDDDPGSGAYSTGAAAVASVAIILSFALRQ